MSDLVGFIFEHKADDLSLWLVDLREEDRRVIEEIAMKYDTSGVSVRGGITYESIGF